MMRKLRRTVTNGKIISAFPVPTSLRNVAAGKLTRATKIIDRAKRYLRDRH